MTYTQILSLSAAVAVTAGGLFVVVPPAYGKSQRVVVTAPADMVIRKISYADLNLASASGEQTLNRRVGTGVNGLCREAAGPESRELSVTVHRMKCHKFAWSQARPQIGRAVQRARDIASTGTSPIAATAITIALPE